MIEKRTALTAKQNKPALPGGVNEVNPRKAGCSEPEQKTDLTEPEKDLPDLPAPEFPELLPDLTRLFKCRSRDVDVLRKCKHLLIAGMPPGKVALLLRLPLERVRELYNSSYNPRFRRFAKTNAYTNTRLVFTSFNEGAELADICDALGLPLFTVIFMLRENGVSDAAMAPLMPPYNDPLCVEYRRVCERKATSRFKTIRISPVRCVKKSQQATA